MEFQFDNSRPIYIQLIEQIELAVATGTYPPGGRLPSVRELASSYGVNPNTVQRALADLEATGLLQAVSTSGRFVTEDTALISQSKKNLATDLTTTYSTKMNSLGYTNHDISVFFANVHSEKN